MAIGWLSVLKMVPWTEVIGSAPKVADSAKKLWSTVANKPAVPPAADGVPQPALSPELQAIARLENELAAVKAAAAELHGQMLTSSALIQSLAEQNTQLIRRIEVERVRLLWLAAATAIVALAAGAALIVALLR